MARPLYYSTSPVSVDPSSGGSVSPARKTASVLEPNPGVTVKPDCSDATLLCNISHLTVNSEHQSKVSLVFYTRLNPVYELW